MLNRRNLFALAVFAAFGADAAIAQRTPINRIRTGPSLVPAHPIVNGQLYRETSAPQVYLAQDQTLFWIPTPDALTSMGFGWNVTVVPDGSLSWAKFSAPSASPTPGSVVYPPAVGEGLKLRPLAGAVPGARRLNFRGTELHLGELRGWLRMVDDPGDGCGDGSDFQYTLELDTDWALAQGIDIHRVLRVGNIAHVGHPQPGYAVRRMVALPLVKIELNSWPRGPEDGPRTKPADWTWVQDCGGTPRTFPFNPLEPGAGTRLGPFEPSLTQRGPYVRISGSLVTDHPHDYAHDLGQWFSRVFGWTTNSEQEWGGSVPDWAPGIRSDDARHPARWTEIHPPDVIEALPNPPAPRVTTRGVALVARPGINSCEEVVFVMMPDTPRPSPTARVGWQELRGPETYFPWGEGKDGSWIVDGVVLINVRARVCGGGIGGSPGRFKAIYRVWWQ